MFNNSAEPRENWAHSKNPLFCLKDTRAVLRFLVKNVQTCKSVYSKLFFLWSVLPLCFCKYAFCKALCFDCFMNKYLYSKIINAHHYSDWEMIFTSKTTFIPFFFFEGACRNPPLKYSLSWSLISYFSTSILNAEKISNLVVCFVTPQTCMCERNCFETTNLWGNLTYSQMLHRWGASTGILN